MKYLKNLIVFVLLSGAIASGQTYQNDKLKAYYTRLEFDDSDITGKYADVVVELQHRGVFVFSREYSYQPYWQPEKGKLTLVDRLIPRNGDGPGNRPDKNNICSNAAIVDRTDSSVTVHWRYAPDITKPSFTNFLKAYNEQGNPSAFYAEYADEYYTIKNDGSVIRIVKAGCYRVDEWEDPKNQYTQELNLNRKGLEQISLTEPMLSETKGTILTGSGINRIEDDGAILSFDFDEALSAGKGWTHEKVSNIQCTILGVESYWEKGISGTSLLFDSYSNAVVLPSDKVPVIVGEFSICAWIAPLEYPFNVAAIIDHLSGDKGYFLGMNRMGEIVFMVGNQTGIIEARTPEIPLYEWNYVVSTYSPEKGLKIYINGKLAASKASLDKFIDAPDTDISIGMTKSFRQYPYGAQRKATKAFQSQMVFSGTIDELTVFNSELSYDTIRSNYDLQRPKTSAWQFRPYVLPDGEPLDNFGARFSILEYHKTWDGLWRTGKYSDLVVTFENEPWRYVFWRGTRYLPSLVTDYGRSGIWSNDQSPELFNGECFEHMSDMLCRFSNIRLISNNPARVIVHWRVASASIGYSWPEYNDLGQGVWTDEYWTIYPDGTSVRHQVLHNSTKANIIEMNQNEILHHPGQTTEGVLMDNALIIANERGDLQSWFRLSEEPSNTLEGKKNLLYTNLNSSTKHFQIGEVGTDIKVHLHRDRMWKGWNHYPSQLIPSDGTIANKYDRAASSCPSTFMENRRQIDEVTIEAMQIYGLTRSKPDKLLPLNRSWNFAPSISALSGCEALEYNKAEKAYYLRKMKGDMSFQIEATSDSPLVNPAFVIRDFYGKTEDMEIMINNTRRECRKGIELDTKGKPKLVFWLKYSSDKPTKIEIIKKG